MAIVTVAVAGECVQCAKKQVPLFVYQQHVIHLAFLEKSPMGTNDSAKHCFDFVGI